MRGGRCSEDFFRHEDAKKCECGVHHVAKRGSTTEARRHGGALDAGRGFTTKARREEGLTTDCADDTDVKEETPAILIRGICVIRG